MTRRILLLPLLLTCCISIPAQVTLEQCIALAIENYPLIKKYGLVKQTQDINLSNINKSWLPQITVYGQGTIQNAVPSFPGTIAQLAGQTGTHIQGLEKLQYKAGIDLNQTIWDGGNSKALRNIETAQHAEQQASLDVQLYAVKERVENLFFGILLTDEQIKQTEAMATLLQSNLDRLIAMNADGTATQSDADMVEAQYLSTQQQLTQAKSASHCYRKMLELFIGKDTDGQPLAKPEAIIPGDLYPDRPEQQLYTAQMRANEARSRYIRASLMPRIGLFAQSYYGYPGFDYFKSMMKRDLSLNLLAGIKISWNIGSFYTQKNDIRKLILSSENIRNEQDVFLFNTNLQTQSHTHRIDELRDVMKKDARIVELRANVRKAAESQLANGVIDATGLLTKLTDEKQARLTAAYHEIQLLQSIYQLKHTLNK